MDRVEGLADVDEDAPCVCVVFFSRLEDCFEEKVTV